MNPTEQKRRPTQTLASNGSQSYSYDTHDDDRSKADALWDLIADEDWEALIELISDFPQLARIRNRVPNSIQFNLPLHEVCRRQPPLQVVNLLLSLYDEAVHTPGQYGFFPLHVACGTGASYDVVTRLIDSYPAATRCRDDVKDALPLHLAAQWGASEEVLMEILTTHPEGSFIRDASGKTPLDHAKALPEGEVKQYAISALETAPVLVATAKSAALRVEREMESRIKSLKDAHHEFTRQMEKRHDDEKTEFLQLEVKFHNELAAEKERNCELAEVILRLQKREWKESEERDALQQRLEEQQAEFKARWRQQERDLKAILAKAAFIFPEIKDRSSEVHQEEAEEKKDGDAKEDGPHSIDATLSSSSDLLQPPSTPILLSRFSQLVSRYNETEEHLKKAREDLHSRGAIVQQLNDLIKKKEREIQSLTSQLQDERMKNETASADLKKMGLLHKEAVQEVYSFKNELNRLKRRSENQQQQLQEARRKLEVRERRMEKVKGLVASLSLNVDRWDIDPEEAQTEVLQDISGIHAAHDDASTDPTPANQNSTDVLHTRFQDISAIIVDQSDFSTGNGSHVAHVSDDKANDSEDAGLGISMSKTRKILDKSSEDSNETAMTANMAEDELDDENLSFLSRSQHSSSLQVVGTIRPIDSDLV